MRLYLGVKKRYQINFHVDSASGVRHEPADISWVKKQFTSGDHVYIYVDRRCSSRELLLLTSGQLQTVAAAVSQEHRRRQNNKRHVHFIGPATRKRSAMYINCQQHREGLSRSRLEANAPVNDSIRKREEARDKSYGATLPYLAWQTARQQGHLLALRRSVFTRHVLQNVCPQLIETG